MEELKFIERENMHMGDALEGIHNYYNYYRDSFIKEAMDFTKKFYEDSADTFDFDLGRLCVRPDYHRFFDCFSDFVFGVLFGDYRCGRKLVEDGKNV